MTRFARELKVANCKLKGKGRGGGMEIGVDRARFLYMLQRSQSRGLFAFRALVLSSVFIRRVVYV